MKKAVATPQMIKEANEFMEAEAQEYAARPKPTFELQYDPEEDVWEVWNTKLGCSVGRFSIGHRVIAEKYCDWLEQEKLSSAIMSRRQDVLSSLAKSS